MGAYKTSKGKYLRNPKAYPVGFISTPGVVLNREVRTVDGRVALKLAFPNKSKCLLGGSGGLSNNGKENGSYYVI